MKLKEMQANIPKEAEYLNSAVRELRERGEAEVSMMQLVSCCSRLFVGEEVQFLWYTFTLLLLLFICHMNIQSGPFPQVEVGRKA